MFGVGFLPYPSVFDKTFSTQFLNGGKQEKIKKRLLSMLMAVLMIASLVPATAMAAPACTVNDWKTVKVSVDVKAKTPGVTAQVCAACGEVKNLQYVPFAKTECKTCTHFAKFVVQEANCTQPGLTVTYCTDCGKVTDVIAPVGTATVKHDYKFFVAVKPTCTNPGWGYAVCQLCNEPVFVSGPSSDVIKDYVKAADQKDIKALYEVTDANHKDKDKWVAATADSKDPVIYAEVKASHVPTVNGVENQALAKGTANFIHVDAQGNFWAYGNVDVKAGQGVVGSLLCPDCGEVRNANVDGNVAPNLNETHKTIVVKSGSLPTNKIDPLTGKIVATYDGETDTVYCYDCDKTYGGETISYDSYTKAVAFGTKAVAGVDVKNIPGAHAYKAATCTEDGYTGDVYVWTEVQNGTADIYGNPAGKWVFNSNGSKIDALGHDLKVKADVPATCEKYGVKYIGVYECARKDCDKLFDVNDNDITAPVENIVKNYGVGTYNVGSAIVQIVAPTEHAWNNMVLVAPTCYSNGLTAVACKDCGIVNKKLVAVTKPVAHVAADELANVVEATCTEAGYSGDQVWKWCGEILKKGEEVPALGHKTEVKDAKAATCTEAGYTGDEVCTVCGETVKKGTEIPALGHKFENGVCTVCGAADPNYVVPNPFKDVEKTSPYYDAIIWAAKEEITTGKTADTFGIDEGCTRAQIVTFLYRAAGSPEVKADTVNPFTDVSKDSVYYNAILWAVEKGITKGTTETTFDPNAVCTRGQIVTFLFRASGDEKVATGTNFADVASGSYCADAVAWAVANKVANGFADGTFRPEATCTRGQAVTFIYRALAE